MTIVRLAGPATARRRGPSCVSCVGTSSFAERFVEIEPFCELAAGGTTDGGPDERVVAP